LFVWIGEGREDFSGDSKVGMVHVLAFFGFGEAESDAAEIGWSARHIKFLTQRSIKAREGDVSKGIGLGCCGLPHRLNVGAVGRSKIPPLDSGFVSTTYIFLRLVEQTMKTKL